MLESINSSSCKEKQDVFHEISAFEGSKNRQKCCRDHNNNHKISNDSDSAMDSADSFEVIFRKYVDSEGNESVNEDTILYNKSQNCTRNMEKDTQKLVSTKCSFISSKQILKIYLSKIEMISQSYNQYMNGLDDALKKYKSLCMINQDISNTVEVS